MTLVHRVLHPSPITSLAEYLERGGGKGFEAAAAIRPQRIIALVRSSGLRGRGGAGYSTGRKWQTVARNRSPVEPSTVVVNGAEGEPGTFKDRTILRTNPYQVIEGAIIAAKAVGADLIIIALKRSFEVECARVRAAVDEITAAGWTRGLQLEIFEGPDEYLYGEESALLETIQGGYPFPRVVGHLPPGSLQVVRRGGGGGPRRRPDRLLRPAHDDVGGRRPRRTGAGQQRRDDGQHPPHRRPRAGAGSGPWAPSGPRARWCAR